MPSFQLDIVTPEKKIYSGLVNSFQAPGSTGSFQILYNHAPLITTLGRGRIKVETAEGEELNYSIEGGVVEVLRNTTNVLVERIDENV